MESQHFQQSLEKSVQEIFAQYDSLNESARKHKRKFNQTRLRCWGAQASLRRNRSPPILPNRNLSYIQELLQTPLCNYLPHSDNDCSWDWQTEFRYTERALIHLLFATGLYRQVHRAIGLMNLERLPPTWYLELDEIWDHSSYYLADPHRVNQLTPVNRYRIRRKTPCPTERLTGRRKYKIHEEGRKLLESKYNLNERPKRKDKEKIVEETGLSYETVTNWFKNKRQRLNASNMSRQDSHCRERNCFTERVHMELEIGSDTYWYDQGFCKQPTGWGSQDSGYSSGQGYGSYEAIFQTETPYSMPMLNPEQIIGYQDEYYQQQSTYCISQTNTCDQMVCHQQQQYMPAAHDQLHTWSY